MFPTNRSGAVQQVETDRGVNLLKGEAITLAASAARTATAGTNGTPVVLQGERSVVGVLFNLTACAHEAGDTLDLYLDFLGPDGATWINSTHFTQEHGDHVAAKYWVNLIPNVGSAAPLVVTSDAGAGVVRPEVFGSQIRARWVIADSGDADASFTFSVYAYCL